MFYLVTLLQIGCSLDSNWINKINKKQGESITIGNSMICSDIWHKYYSWYFKIVSNFTCLTARNYTQQFPNNTCGIYAKYHYKLCYCLYKCHIQIMLLFVYTITRKRFAPSTCNYFKLRNNPIKLQKFFT